MCFFGNKGCTHANIIYFKQLREVSAWNQKIMISSEFQRKYGERYCNLLLIILFKLV